MAFFVQRRVTDFNAAATAAVVSEQTRTKCVVCVTVNLAASVPPTAAFCCTELPASIQARRGRGETCMRRLAPSTTRGTAPSAHSTVALIATCVRWPSSTAGRGDTCRSSTSDLVRVSHPYFAAFAANQCMWQRCVACVSE